MATLEFRGPHAEFLQDETPEIDLEGSRDSGKTIVCLWKELEAHRRWPGLWSLIARYSDDATKTLLRPELERVAKIHGTDLGRWNAAENAYELPRGGRIFCFGLKTVSADADTRYKKIRGLSVSRIYIDQAEELPADIASELRFPLRPDIAAVVAGRTFPTQLTFSPNPAEEGHWLSRQFPTTNSIAGRKYYGLSIYDNAHNLLPAQLTALELEYPPEHPRHQTLILGVRGPNVTGEGVFEHLYDRRIHRRPLTVRTDAPILEAFAFGTHTPTYVAAQRGYFGGLRVLGGIQGQRLLLADFLPCVWEYRDAWFPGAEFLTAAPPMGESRATATQARAGLVHAALRDAGLTPHWRADAHAPDVQLALIEELGGYLRRRFGTEEAFGVNDLPARWLVATLDGVTERPFLSYAFDGGFVWDDDLISVGHERIRRPKDDSEYAPAIHAVFYILLQFCVRHRSEADQVRRQLETRQQLREQGRPADGPYAWLGH